MRYRYEYLHGILDIEYRFGIRYIDMVICHIDKVIMDIDMGDEANDMGDDSIDMVISLIDMGYLVTLVESTIHQFLPSTKLAIQGLTLVHCLAQTEQVCSL